MEELMVEVRSVDVLVSSVFMQEHPEVNVEDSCRFNVTDLTFRGSAIIRDNCRLNGRKIDCGPNFYMDHHACIGGGWSELGSFKCGRNFHLGAYSMINIARDVTIGDNVGVGMFSLLATHGYYLDVTEGFPGSDGPISIGNNVWLPKVTVLPGVRIGDNTVVAADSLVNRDIEGGGLWAGIPARRIEGVKYPNPWSKERKEDYIKQFNGDRNLLRRHGIRD